MNEKEFREKLSELQAMVAIRNASITPNPLYALRQMEKRCRELREVLDQVHYALSPMYIVDVWESDFDKSVFRSPADIHGEALIRCDKAREILLEYRLRNP